jgi:hypothetical protein
MPYVRTKQKGTEVISDLHHITNKAIEIPDEEMRAAYFVNNNIEIFDDPKHPKATTVTEET